MAGKPQPNQKLRFRITLSLDPNRDADLVQYLLADPEKRYAQRIILAMRNGMAKVELEQLNDEQEQSFDFML